MCCFGCISCISTCFMCLHKLLWACSWHLWALLWNECVHGHPVLMEDLHAPAPHMAGLISSPVGPNLRHEKSRKSSKNGVTESHACVFVANHSFLGPAPRKSRKVTESHGESRVALCLSLFPTQPLAKQMHVSFAIGLEKTNYTQVVGA